MPAAVPSGNGSGYAVQSCQIGKQFLPDFQVWYSMLSSPRFPATRSPVGIRKVRAPVARHARSLEVPVLVRPQSETRHQFGTSMRGVVFTGEADDVPE